MNVPVYICENQFESIQEAIQQHIPKILMNNFPLFISEQMVHSFQPGILYHLTDFIKLNFNLFYLETLHQIFIAGPYLTIHPNMQYCENVLQENGKSLSLLTPLFQFYLTLPVIGNSSMLNASRTAIKNINETENEFIYHHYQPQRSYQKEISNLSVEGADDLQIELLERRYYYENLMLQEVRMGNSEQALSYYNKFHDSSRNIVRTEDPVRTSKNLSFSLNTMLRKSVETLGIHPIHLDIISSNFAMLIEDATRLNEIYEIQSYMISAYCRFVRKYKLDQYSPIIRKAITYIQTHLSDDLSLQKISGNINISSSYLSRMFNQEVQQSISNYITQVRVNKAEELLQFSQMSIQNIASYVGFHDFNYFSKCFKKYKHITPTECRQLSAVKE